MVRVYSAMHNSILAGVVTYCLPEINASNILFVSYSYFKENLNSFCTTSCLSHSEVLALVCDTTGSYSCIVRKADADHWYQ